MKKTITLAAAIAFGAMAVSAATDAGRTMPTYTAGINWQSEAESGARQDDNRVASARNHLDENGHHASKSREANGFDTEARAENESAGSIEWNNARRSEDHREDHDDD